MKKKNNFKNVFCALSVALFFAAHCPHALAADLQEDLPAPQEEGATQSLIPSDGNTNSNVEPLPDVGSPPGETGVDDLPAPSNGQENTGSGQVNVPEEKDDVFLPTPGAPADDSVFISAPSQNYSNGNNTSRYSTGDWKSSMGSRPAFSASIGFCRRTYDTTGVPDAKGGYVFGASYRLFDLGQTVFLHFYADLTTIRVGDVNADNGTTPYTDVHDLEYHYGPMLEVGVGRRLSLYGAILKEVHYITAAPTAADTVKPDPGIYLAGIGYKPKWVIGVGGQYDFYVVPHGSLGVRGYIQSGMMTASLVLSLEPIPKKRLSF